MIRKRPQRKGNRIEYHTQKQANGSYRLLKLTIHPDNTFKTHTVDKNRTQEDAENWLLRMTTNKK